MGKPNHITTLITQGEHVRLDFKFAITDAAKIAKSLSAFSNTHGGTLLIGVKDNGVVVGVHSDEEFYMVDSAARCYCRPQVDFTYENWTVEGKTVLEVIIPETPTKPVECKGDDGRFWSYVRIEDQNILAHPVQILTWEKMQRQKGALICYTDKEAHLMQALKGFNFLTMSQIKRKTRLKHFELLHLLSDLAAMNVIGISQTEEQCKFYLREM